MWVDGHLFAPSSYPARYLITVYKVDVDAAFCGLFAGLVVSMLYQATTFLVWAKQRQRVAIEISTC